MHGRLKAHKPRAAREQAPTYAPGSRLNLSYTDLDAINQFYARLKRKK